MTKDNDLFDPETYDYDASAVIDFPLPRDVRESVERLEEIYATKSEPWYVYTNEADILEIFVRIALSNGTLTTPQARTVLKRFGFRMYC